MPYIVESKCPDSRKARHDMAQALLYIEWLPVGGKTLNFRNLESNPTQ